MNAAKSQKWMKCGYLFLWRNYSPIYNLNILKYSFFRRFRKVDLERSLYSRSEIEEKKKFKHASGKNEWLFSQKIGVGTRPSIFLLITWRNTLTSDVYALYSMIWLPIMLPHFIKQLCLKILIKYHKMQFLNLPRLGSHFTIWLVGSKQAFVISATDNCSW